MCSFNKNDILPSRWLTSHNANVEKMDSRERGMHSDTITIINPQKEIGRAEKLNQESPLHNLPIKLQGFGNKI